MDLKNKMFRLVSFSLVDTALIKAMGGVAFFIIVHLYVISGTIQNGETYIKSFL